MIEINPADLEKRDVYKLMTGSIVPRPIAWVSTLSKDGVCNLAPFSYFTAVSANPPIVLFSVGTRSADQKPKDTYYNVRDTGEFVVNFVNEDTAVAMNITAVEVPADVDEFERAGLSALPSKTIAAPRVAESLIHFECKLHDIIPAGDSYVVMGLVTWMHFADEVYKTGHYIDADALRPVGRLAGGQYAHIKDLFTLQRPASEISPTSSD